MFLAPWLGLPESGRRSVAVVPRVARASGRRRGGTSCLTRAASRTLVVGTGRGDGADVASAGFDVSSVVIGFIVNISGTRSTGATSSTTSRRSSGSTTSLRASGATSKRSSGATTSGSASAACPPRRRGRRAVLGIRSLDHGFGSNFGLNILRTLCTTCGRTGGSTVGRRRGRRAAPAGGGLALPAVLGGRFCGSRARIMASTCSSMPRRRLILPPAASRWLRGSRASTPLTWRSDP